jgi:uncharacterized metal-binding protein YceD (DUF177 family)
MTKIFELSRIVDLQELKSNQTIVFDIRATTTECQELSKRINVLEVKDLNAHMIISRGSRSDLYKVEGDLVSHVVQECCVTLAPIEENVHEHFSELLTTSPTALEAVDEEDTDAENPVDVIENNAIDVGDIVTQWLALALNPYPRSDAPMFKHIEIDASTAEKQNPFKVLEVLIDSD